MLLFTPQSHYFTPQSHYYRRSPTYVDLQEALAREQYVQEQAAIREELARRAALERFRQQQEAERQRQQRARYLAELERRRYIDAIRRAQRGHNWYFEQPQSDDESDEEIAPQVQQTSPVRVPIVTQTQTRQATLEQRHEAATTIQSAYRTCLARRQASRVLSQIRTSLNDLISNFVFPSRPIFDFTSGSTSHKLSYNSTNAPIHAHEDALVKLLSKLDSVESNGDIVIRKARKSLARDIEAQLELLDRNKEDAWEAQCVERELQTSSLEGNNDILRASDDEETLVVPEDQVMDRADEDLASNEVEAQSTSLDATMEQGSEVTVLSADPIRDPDQLTVQYEAAPQEVAFDDWQLLPDSTVMDESSAPPSTSTPSVDSGDKITFSSLPLDDGNVDEDFVVDMDISESPRIEESLDSAATEVISL